MVDADAVSQTIERTKGYTFLSPYLSAMQMEKRMLERFEYMKHKFYCILADIFGTIYDYFADKAEYSKKGNTNGRTE